ncbi:toxin VasX [Psychrobacter sp.]|uniref:toxin VasX n=1 Tax=Psychrobacter sp. TaxID=56811 RepID=UPI002FD89D6F
MSSDLNFMDRLTNNHRSYQDKKKTEPVVLDLEYKIPTGTDAISVEASTILVTPSKKCAYGCGKTGIPILPVVLSKTDYKVSPRDERYFSHSIIPIPSSHNAVASLPTHSYLYCYVEDNEGCFWYEYYIGFDGALKEKRRLFEEDFVEDTNQSGQIDVQNIDESNDHNFDEGAQPFNCTEKNHSTLDSKYITLLQGDTAWLMVSHAQLSKVTLKKYIDDEMLRNKRMQKFVADDLTGNKNTVNMSVNETDYIKSFSRRKQLAQDRDIASRIDVLEQSGGSDIVGGTVAATALYRSMERSIAEYGEALALEIKPMMVALHDPVGEVLAAAEKRNYLLKKLDDAQKDKGKIREQVNAIIIDNIKSSIEAANQSSVYEQHSYSRSGLDRNYKANSAVGRNVYSYIDESKFKAVLASAKKSRKDKESISQARQVFVGALKNSEFAFVMREDFIENDEDSHASYAQIIAEATQGIGIDESNIGVPDAIWADHQPEQVSGMTAKQEFEQTLLPCLSGEKPPEDNWLSKALIGLNPEDNQKMQDAPTYENFARASDFIGTATNWLNTFKNEAKQKAIDAKTAQKIQYLNELASYKAQVVQTMSNNMSHIKGNNRWLYKMDLWTQASVNQSTGLRLAQKILKYSPDKATKVLGGFLNNRINKAKPHKTLIPASIDIGAVKQGSGSSVPFAVDFMHSLAADQQVLDIYNNAASGDKNAQMTVTLYTDKATAQAAASVNQSLADAQTDLNKYVDSHSGAQRQLERSSAGKAALISAGIGLFQLRSVWMGKSNLNAMAARRDLIAREFMTSYASTSLALTGAALDVAAAGMQIRGASTTAIARLSLGVGVLGAVGAGFEVYSLELTQQRMIDGKSNTSAKVTGIAQLSAGVAGMAGLAIGLGFVMPWVIGIMAVAWAVSLIAQWVAFSYDKSHILPIHYWLDAGVFGNKAMLNDEYPNNPFKIQAMSSLEQDMHAYSLALTEIQVNPKFATNTANFRQTLSGQIEIALSQWNDDSELVVEFIGIGSRELGLDRKSFSIETLKRQNQVIETSRGLKVVLDIPKTSHFQAQYLGSYREGTRDPNKEHDMQEAREIAQANAGREVDKLRAVVKYALNPSMNPYYQLRTSVTSQ